MRREKFDVIIIGAGLAGLSLAYQLRHWDKKILIVEARDRLGGRIQTLRKPDKAPLELGATWLGKKHDALLQLLTELGLSIFEQALGDHAIYEAISTSPPQLVELPPNGEPSFRIKGGTDLLIGALADHLSVNTEVRLGTPVLEVIDRGDCLHLRTAGGTLEAKRVVSTLPPLLLHNTVKLPELPDKLVQVMQSTHTWMGESIKVGLYVDAPFWLSRQSSATLFSNVGPVNELYQHSSIEGDRHALMGFLQGSYHCVSQEDRQAVVMNQLGRYYDQDVLALMHYEDKVWRQEKYTFTVSEEDIIPHQNNGHPIFGSSILGGKVIIAGSETSREYPGYMDGAVRSSVHVANMLRAGGQVIE